MHANGFMSVKIAVFCLNPSREIAVYFVPMELSHVHRFSKEQVLVVRLSVVNIILSAHENLASCAHTFLRIVALENLVVERLQLRFPALLSTKDHAHKMLNFMCEEYSNAFTMLLLELRTK